MQKPVLTNFVRPVAYLVACLLFLVTGLGQNVVVQALSQENLNSIYNDTVWYKTDDSTSDSCVIGGGTLPSSVPKPYNGIFSAAASKFHVAPAFLAALFYAGEHGSSWPNPPPPYGSGSPWARSGVKISGAADWPDAPPGKTIGARGPFQFEYPTWQSYKVDGNGDGKEDPEDLTDAAFSASKYLAAAGAQNTTNEAKLRQVAANYNGVGDPNASYPTNVWNAFVKFSSGGAASGNNSLDLNSIVKKYNLQSAVVKRVGDSVVASQNADQSPTSPASVLKLIIADVFLHTNPDLNTKRVFTQQETYGAGDDMLVGHQYTLKDILTRTLDIRSSNDGANALIDAVGGLAQVTAQAHTLGYTSTNIVAYYHDPPKAINKTTSSDLTQAMEKIYTASGSRYEVAKNALNENYFHISPNPLAAKWGMNSTVTGNSAVFATGGSNYIITMYINQTGKNAAIKGATEDIIAALGNIQPSSGASSPACSSSSNVVQTILKYAWPQSGHQPETQPTQAYIDAIATAKANGKYIGASGGGYDGIDCGAFVTRVMQDSGADPAYGGGGNTLIETQYLTSSGKYQKVSFNAVQDLQTGDIAINDSHTFIYMGNVSGFNGNIASASQSTRAPSAGNAGISYLKGFTWYRLVQ